MKSCSAQLECEAIALDESNAIKTAATQTAQAAYRLKGRFKVALSGTPMENRPEEIGSQFRFLLPGLSLQTNALELMQRKMPPLPFAAPQGRGPNRSSRKNRTDGLDRDG